MINGEGIFVFKITENFVSCVLRPAFPHPRATAQQPLSVVSGQLAVVIRDPLALSEA